MKSFNLVIEEGEMLGDEIYLLALLNSLSASKSGKGGRIHKKVMGQLDTCGGGVRDTAVCELYGGGYSSGIELWHRGFFSFTYEVTRYRHK